MRAPAGWSRPQPTWFARALSPLGALYGAATLHRMARPGVRVGVPVICVGNFVVGGAGKTPTAIALARLLIAAGERPAFLSRGYGGEVRGGGRRVSADDEAGEVGDEPLLLARVAPCYVGPDRVASARRAVLDGASVLVMDDGLQNPSLAKSLSVAVVDGDNPFGNGLCLPAGPLRAPLAAQLPFVDAIVVVGGEGRAKERIARRAAEKPIFAASLRAEAVAASALIGRPTLAFAGVARPEKFFASLRQVGALVEAARAFPDHWRFHRTDLERLAAEAVRRRLDLVCTEKDWVRLPRSFRDSVRVLPVTLAFENAGGISALLAEVGAVRS